MYKNLVENKNEKKLRGKTKCKNSECQNEISIKMPLATNVKSQLSSHFCYPLNSYTFDF